MARKVVAEANKVAAVRRIVAGRSIAKDEGRRYGVSAQAVRAWVREMRGEIEMEEKNKGTTPGENTGRGGSNPPSPAQDTPQPPPAASGGVSDERPDADRLAAARAAAGLPSGAPAPLGGGAPAPVPGNPAPPGPPGGGAPDISDEAIVEMAGNFIMGFSTRGSLFLASRKAKVKVKLTPDLESLCILTEKEKAALKPAVPFLAPKIRNFIGSNENVAIGAAITVVGMGVMDRMGAVAVAVREAVAKEPQKAAA